ncbi:hypothetical protein EVAR_84216_1 [Eumeta japonica]|uniref:Retrovirus-related Pol polyprotein from type-1 retrotransposable element R1 n=1 Tax=Eumeta variegata TaxID=151549 RepID=A0A4C1WRZ7_EUMVA|nr:hypothetical protein EVAR_84216_1 [Eumeta japonica]
MQFTPTGRVELESGQNGNNIDHNAIVFNLRLSGPIKPMEPITTRRYNTNKADWTEFCLQLRNTLQKYGIAEKVERTKRPEDLEANSREYIAAIQEPPREKGRNRRLPTAKTIYTQKAEIAQTESWKEYCTTQDKQSMWDKVYRVIRNKKGRLPDTLLRNSEGKTLSPHESAKLLANTFYPDDSVSTDMPFHIRTRERIEDKPVEDLRLSEDDPPFIGGTKGSPEREIRKRLRDQTA